MEKDLRPGRRINREREGSALVLGFGLREEATAGPRNLRCTSHNVPKTLRRRRTHRRHRHPNASKDSTCLYPSFSLCFGAPKHLCPRPLFGRWGPRTLFRSACSASTMSFSRSLIKRPNASSCCVRNSKERVLPELKAFRARCTTSLILLMVPKERRKGPWSFYPVLPGPGAQGQTLTGLRCVNLIERGRSPWELWKCNFILLPQVSNPDILTYLYPLSR